MYITQFFLRFMNDVKKNSIQQNVIFRYKKKIIKKIMNIIY